MRYNHDIEVRFSDTIVDTSALFSPKPVNFEVVDITENKNMDFLFFDMNNNDTVDANDMIIPIIYKNGIPKGTWQIAFKQPAQGETIYPTKGDVIRIVVKKPLTGMDVYQLETTQAQMDFEKAKKEFLENVKVVPNPYIVTSGFEVAPPTVFSAGRGERRIYFMNLPPKCTIRIYTMNGELIRTIEHSSNVFNSLEPWDLLTSEGLDVSYGIYIYHIDAGELGEKIGKFAIIK